MVSSCITKDGMSKRKVDYCGICSLRVFEQYFTCRKCEGNIGEAVEQEVKLCDEVETVSDFTHLGDRVSAGGGCKAAVTTRIRRGLAKFGSVVSRSMAGGFL